MSFKNKSILYIVIGVIIGLVISLNFNKTTPISSQTFFVESDSENEIGYKEYSKPFIEASNKVKPATVFIFTEKLITLQDRRQDPFRDFFDDDFFRRFFGDRFGDVPQQRRERQYRQRGLGSGVIVSPDGYIITNYHVVQNADEIKIQLFTEEEYNATMVGYDSKTDIAILKIEGSDFPYAKLGDSNKLEIGEWILAIGNPFGLSYTVTSGIVSAISRSGIGVADYENFIQTDAPINRGNSGGPMINLNGDVVGINTAIYSQTGGNLGIGFAVPINMVKKIMVDLIEKGKVVRGWLGVYIQDIDSDMAEQFNLPNSQGVLLSQISKDSPADRSGLKRGDVIIEFDGVKISNTSQLRNVVASTQIGKPVIVNVIRDGKTKEIEVTIAAQPDDMEVAALTDNDLEENKTVFEDFGFTVSQLNNDLAKKFNFTENEKGVIIVNIERNSIAQIGGLREGDIIVEINRKPISTIADLRKNLQDSKNDKSVLFLIKRGNVAVYIVINRN